MDNKQQDLFYISSTVGELKRIKIEMRKLLNQMNETESLEDAARIHRRMLYLAKRAQDIAVR